MADSPPGALSLYGERCIDHRNRHSGAARPSAVDPVSYPGRRGIGRHLDPRRARGDGGGLDRRRPAGKPGAAFLGRRGRRRRQRLSRRSGVGRAAVRLSDRPVRPAQIVLCHLGSLLDRDRRHRLLVGFRQLCAVPLCDRRRHRRRVCGDQLGDPGTGAGAVSRAHRSGDQRQLLAGRCTRRGRRGRVPAARPASPGYGLARRVRDRRGTRSRHPIVAQLPPGKPALADAARPARRGRGGNRHDRAPGRGGRGSAASRRADSSCGVLAHAARSHAAGDPA